MPTYFKIPLKRRHQLKFELLGLGIGYGGICRRMTATGEWHWNGSGSGNWSTGSNWDRGEEPTTYAVAYLDEGGIYTVTVDTTTARASCVFVSDASATLTVSSGNVLKIG